MNKEFIFVSGLPRSGSTLLQSILGQNPRIYATGTSGLIDTLLNIRDNWESNSANHAMDRELSLKRKANVMRGVLGHCYDDVDRPIVAEKSRGWPAHLEMAEELTGASARVLVPVRDVRDILASFERLWRQQKHVWAIPQERTNHSQFQTLRGRCEVWASTDQPLGAAYNRIRDAIDRGFGNRLHFVRFGDLTGDPAETMAKIYEFLGEPAFAHDFNNVEMGVSEDDAEHGILNLHVVRRTVAPVPSYWRSVLGEEIGNIYAGQNFWEQ